MQSKIILLLLALLSIAKSHDEIVGLNTEGRKIFDEKREASPAIWRQVQNVTVNTTDNEVISRIVVTDLRPEKDGDVKIIDGGEGHKSATIELKSPTVLRGYEFQIEVYAVPDKNQKAGSQNTPETPQPSQVRKERNPEETLKNDGSNINPPGTRTYLTAKSTENANESDKTPTPISLKTDSKTVDSNLRKTRQTENEQGSDLAPQQPPQFNHQGIPERANIPKIPILGIPVPPFTPPNVYDKNEGNTGTPNGTVSTSNQQSKFTRDTKNQENEKSTTQSSITSNNRDQKAPVIPSAASINKPTNVNNDQTRNVRDVQNEEKSEDQRKPVQPVLPSSVPKISIVDNAPQITSPNAYGRNKENRDQTNSGSSKSTQGIKHIRDTEEQEKDEDTSYYESSINKDRNAPLIPSVAANKPTDINNDQPRKVRQLQNEETSNDQRKPVQPVLPTNLVPKISTASKAPEVISPNVYSSNGENTERTNGAVSTTYQQSKHTRDTKEQGKYEENVQPLTLSNNRNEKSSIVPPVITSTSKDSKTEQIRKVRDVHNQEKSEDKLKSVQPPITVAKKIEISTNNPVRQDEKRVSRDTESEQKTKENIKPTIQINERPFVPANFASSENATKIGTEDKRITRDTQNEEKHDDIYKPRPHITEPFALGNTAKTLENATYNANEKRNARNTYDDNRSNITVSTEKTTDKIPPSLAGTFSRNDDHPSDIPEQKSQEPRNQGRINNDRYPTNDQIKRVTRDTQNAQDAAKSKVIDNDGKKLNPPAVTNKNAESVQPPRTRVPIYRDNKKIPRNNPTTPKAVSNAPRNVRSAENDAPEPPPALPSPTQPRNDADSKSFQFQFQTTDPLLSLFPTTEKTTTTTTTTTTTKKSKRQADSDESDDTDTNIKKVPRIFTAQNVTSTSDKTFEQKPVISIQ